MAEDSANEEDIVINEIVTFKSWLDPVPRPENLVNKYTKTPRSDVDFMKNPFRTNENFKMTEDVIHDVAFLLNVWFEIMYF